MKRLLAAIVVATLLAAAGIGYWWQQRPEPAETPKSSSSSSSPKISPSPSPSRDWSQEEPQVTEAVESVSSDPEAVLAQSARDDVGGDLRAAVPEGTTVSVVEGSWAPDGIGGGTVLADVTYPGQEPARYLIVVQQESGEWRILATLPVEN